MISDRHLGGVVKTSWIIAFTALCGACTTPMLRSVDLTRSESAGSLVTYGVGVTEVELIERPYGGGDALPEACETALDAYDLAWSAYDDKATPYVRALERLEDGLEPFVEAYEEYRDQQDNREENGADEEEFGDDEPRREPPRALTSAEKRNFLEQIKALMPLAEALLDAQPAANRARRRAEEHCPYEPVRLDAVAHVRPSAWLLFGLDLEGGAMSNDALNLVVGVDGLPVSLTASADDQSGVAIGNVARLIGRFTVPGGGLEDIVVTGVRSTGRAGPPIAADACRLSALTPSRRVAEMEKRLACVDLPSVLVLLSDVHVELEEYDDLRPDPPRPPARYSVEQLEGRGVKYAGLTVRATCVSPRSYARSPGRDEPSLSPQRPEVPLIADGVVVATPTPCQLEAAAPDEDHPRRYSFIGLRDSYLSVVPVERADLVKNTTTLNFTNGMVTTVDVSRPSVGAAAFGLPAQVITNIVGGVTDAFGDSQSIEEARVAQMNAETSRLNAEAARITQPEPAWDAADTRYVAAQGEVESRRAEYERDLAAEEPDPVQVASSAAALRNAKAAANAAAQDAGRPLPYPEML